jgi:RsiW-degrading membrane proteinase PrsW (M82 family)
MWGVALFSLAGALAPVAFMLHFVYVRDKYEREPLGLLLRVYFISFLTVIPAVVLEVLGTAALDASHPDALVQLALLAFVVVGGAEEGTKFVFLRWLAVKRPEFNETYDGILYGVAVSLGFATVENIAYVFSSPVLGERVAVIVARALVSVPGHALWGAIMGYYVGRAKFAPDPRRRVRLLWLGLVLPVLLHGSFDFWLFAATEGVGGDGALVLSVAAFIATVITSWVLSLRIIRRAQAESPFKRPYLLVRPLASLNPAYKYCIYCGVRAAHTDVYCRSCGRAWPARAR